ncbi:PREDICTED: uncharacterized protein LOC108613816 [Drosophila arizonae]|uniref:Uncharacterized protein LOC108613816 n=1 Tax=Drosophila arizonae TaxID=7263 RepID=A0ABM1P753_DROAR|nr:PREDICTED: uncharacterized protein LOC108613816 [Drosophila arizonae]
MSEQQAKVFEVLCVLVLTGGLRPCAAEVFQQCNNVDADTFVMVIEDCTSYIYCNGEDSFRDSCPEQTYFDAQAQECAFDDTGICLKAQEATTVAAAAAAEAVDATTSDNSDGVQIDAATDAPTDPDSEQQTKPAGNRPHCDSTGDGYHPHPERCEYYYSCIAGYLTIVRCPYKYGWDYAQQQCRPLPEARCFSL